MWELLDTEVAFEGRECLIYQVAQITIGLLHLAHMNDALVVDDKHLVLGYSACRVRNHVVYTIAKPCIEGAIIGREGPPHTLEACNLELMGAMAYLLGEGIEKAGGSGHQGPVGEPLTLLVNSAEIASGGGTM
eukprot:TRINITY_DN38510_c0_g1_i1.p2 TRINITY_DN38510_c0_g1~~TRINITY_DN38510_c0_g1_i1.p2  ORF type:complete len:133 (-),score=1.25 TRINITY_DN38510_c0_g1_i1:69-467(-)